MRGECQNNLLAVDSPTVMEEVEQNLCRQKWTLKDRHLKMKRGQVFSMVQALVNWACSLRGEVYTAFTSSHSVHSRGVHSRSIEDKCTERRCTAIVTDNEGPVQFSLAYSAICGDLNQLTHYTALLSYNSTFLRQPWAAEYSDIRGERWRHN